MKDLKDILNSGREPSEVINDLKAKSVSIPSWDSLLQDYDPMNHAIMHDPNRAPVVREGAKAPEQPSRIHLGLERLLTSRLNEFTFATPVRRDYKGVESDVQTAIVNAIESIYKHARIDTENLNRGRAYYAACEFFTIWYAVKKPNSLYGFPSAYKLKCKTYSPMDGTRLYPLFDELGDLLAMSFEYKRKIKDKETWFFETYTEDKKMKWQQDYGSSSWTLVDLTDGLSIGKIPGVYQYRPRPCWNGLSHLRNELEYALSRQSDIVAYNAAPVMKVSGTILGAEEQKGVSKRVYNVENGGDIAYVAWDQSVAATQSLVNDLLNQFFMQSQMPDISFHKLMSVGNVSADTLRTLLMDAHLRIGDEKGVWIETLEREFNVILAFLAQMNTSWAKELDNISCDHIITPFTILDDAKLEERLMKINGGSPLVSHLESIQMYGHSDNPSKTKEDIDREQQAGALSTMQNAFNEATM